MQPSTKRVSDLDPPCLQCGEDHSILSCPKVQVILNKPGFREHLHEGSWRKHFNLQERTQPESGPTMKIDFQEPEVVLHASGAKRERSLVRWDLLPLVCIRRLALIYTEGAPRYGERNWEAGIPNGELINHILEHAYRFFVLRNRSEDHLAKIAWGVFALMWNQEMEASNSHA